MIDPDLARREALAEADELVADPDWKVAFTGAVPGPAILIRDRSRKGRDYFIVDFRIGERSTARMIVNATTGVIDEVTGIEEEGEALPDFLPPAAVLSRIAGQIVLDDGRVIERPEGTPTIEMVWDHSRESQTRFVPFYWVRWPSGELYIRVDGSIFLELTRPGLPRRDNGGDSSDKRRPRG
jgi:hypothetical protein